jgi:general secretion pathway protein A
MYASYFGFREKPFNVTPDPRFFYTNPNYQEAYANLFYGIRERKGFVVVTGEVGTGKTTLLRRLMDELDESVHFVFFYHTQLTFEEMLSFICEDFDLPVGTAAGSLQKIQALNEFLLARLSEGGTGVLLIDEAQNLSDAVLENLRLLSNLETAREKLLQIVLVGQPELELKLAQPQLRQFKQRVMIQCRLGRLKDQEIGPFIHHRLHVVGYDRQDLFPPEVIQRIAVHAKGIPRLINVICDNALLIAYGTSQRKVSPEIVEEVAQDLGLKTGSRVILWKKEQKFHEDISQAGQAFKQPPRAESAVPREETPGVEPVPRKARQERPEVDRFLRSESRRLRRIGLGTLLTLALLGGAGAAFFPQQTAALLADLHVKLTAMLGTVGEQFSSLKRELSARLAILPSGEARQGEVAEPTSVPPAIEPGLRRQEKAVAHPQEQPLVLAEQSPPSSLEQMGLPYRETSLTRSAGKGDTRAVEFLLAIGVSPDVKDTKGWTALMYAAWGGLADTVQVLLDRGANVNAKNDDGRTALMLAAMNGHAGIIQDLLNRGADVRAKDARGWTTLMYATWHGHAAIVQTLLKQGANAKAKDAAARPRHSRSQ